MKCKLGIFLISGILLQVCAIVPTASAAKYVGKYPLLFSETVPLQGESYIQVNGAYYKFPEQCLLGRSHGDVADNRLHGDQADARQHGDQGDSRLHGDKADDRLHGDQADARQHGDLADNRLHGDQADARQHGDLADNRLHGDQADARLHGDQGDNRMHGDKADARLHGDQMNQFKCAKINAHYDVVITGFTGAETINVAVGNQFGDYQQLTNLIFLKF